MKHNLCLIFLLAVAFQFNIYSASQEKMSNFGKIIKENEDEIRRRYGVHNLRLNSQGGMTFTLENPSNQNIENAISTIHNLTYQNSLYDEYSATEARHDCVECAGKCFCCYSCFLTVCFSLTNIKK